MSAPDHLWQKYPRGCRVMDRREYFDQVLSKLKHNWALDLSPKSSLESPSKRFLPGSKEGRAYQSINFLVFNGQQELEHALRTFARRAGYVHSKWVFKPAAELGTLPAREPSDSLMHQVGPSSKLETEKREKLMEALVALLEEAKTDVQKRKPPGRQIGASFTSFLHGDGLETGTNVQPMAPCYADTEMRDAAKTSFESGEDQAAATDSDESMRTAPESPVNYPALPKDTPFFEQRLDKVPTNHRRVSSPVKRRLPESDGERLRKNSRHSSELTLEDAHNVNDFVPTSNHTSFSMDSIFSNAPSFKATGATSLPTSVNTSFESNTHLPSKVTSSTSFHIPTKTSFERFAKAPTKAASTSLNESVNTSFDFKSSHLSSNKSSASFHTPGATSDKSDVTVTAACRNIANKTARVVHLEKATKEIRNSEVPKSFEAAAERKAPQPFERRVMDESSLSISTCHAPEKVPFRTIYEVSRVALHCGLQSEHLFKVIIERGLGSTDNYDELWGALKHHITRIRKTMPERSSVAAWKHAVGKFERIQLSARLTFADQAKKKLFNFQLNPLHFGSSNRFSRKFGGHRFLILLLPGLGSKDLPKHFESEETAIRIAVIDWLVDNGHSILSRVWGGFLVKPHEAGPRKSKDSNVPRHRVFLFAIKGLYLYPGGDIYSEDCDSYELSIEDFMKWHISFEEPRNCRQPALKLFARFQLGVSATTPTFIFKSHQIVRTRDAHAQSESLRSGVRRLAKDSESLRLKRRSGFQEHEDGPLMNDGCGRISIEATKRVATMLGLTNVPSAFQGRIGGAKGLWIIDPLGELNGDDEVWIEATESQLKFDPHAEDEIRPDDYRLTFDVHAVSSSLRPASLNFQLMPILVNRGVPPEVLSKLLDDDLAQKTEELAVAMSSGPALRAWNQKTFFIPFRKNDTDQGDWEAGIPRSDSEQINWYTEHGFEPKTCSQLQKVCEGVAGKYCDKLEDRMSIQLGRSTYAYMVPDPLDVLEEDEIYLGFSSPFTDPKSRFSECFLNDMEVLVARVPASLPSDIQKVRAVLRPELLKYKDVVIFSSRGSRCLADKLSGGDYDGDQAWICWEPTIVSFFSNFTAKNGTLQDLKPEHFGLQKNNTTVSDLLDHPDFMHKFIRLGFDFNIQPAMLGICTAYFEKYCYSLHETFGSDAISQPKAIEIASLLGHLVDSAKSGYKFDNLKWLSFLKKSNLPQRLKNPAYKDRAHIKIVPNPQNHIADYLVGKAEGTKNRALERLHKVFPEKSSQDKDLIRIYHEERKEAPYHDPIFVELLKGIEGIIQYWRSNTTKEDKEKGISFASLVSETRRQFVDLQPANLSDHPMATRWRQLDCGLSTGGAWSRFKASALYDRYQWGGLPFYACGKELGEIKALARGNPSQIIADIHNVMKLDMKAYERRQVLIHKEMEGPSQYDDVEEVERMLEDFLDDYGSMAGSYDD